MALGVMWDQWNDVFRKTLGHAGSQPAEDPAAKVTAFPGNPGTAIPEDVAPKRFYATVKLDLTRMSRDAGKIADEVVRHLTKQLMSEVTITVEIQAKAPGGFEKSDVRILTENCRTLKFDAASFEET